MVFRMTPRRVTRSIGQEAVDAGCPVVTEVFPEGVVSYAGGAESEAVWAEIAPRLVEGKRPPVRDLQWVGRVWESDSGVLMLRFAGQH